jgi:hypothetical protein
MTYYDAETRDNLRIIPKRYTPAMLADFRCHFHLNLHEFWSPITGFDLVKFDETIQTPDGMSCREHLAFRFGAGAVKLVEALIAL